MPEEIEKHPWHTALALLEERKRNLHTIAPSTQSTFTYRAANEAQAHAISEAIMFAFWNAISKQMAQTNQAPAGLEFSVLVEQPGRHDLFPYEYNAATREASFGLPDISCLPQLAKEMQGLIQMFSSAQLFTLEGSNTPLDGQSFYAIYPPVTKIGSYTMHSAKLLKSLISNLTELYRLPHGKDNMVVSYDYDDDRSLFLIKPSLYDALLQNMNRRGIA